jgi:ATP-binding cassette, subfamily B, bacterial
MWGPSNFGGGGDTEDFTGVPSELKIAVAALLETEPDHGEPDAQFTHRFDPEQGRTLSLRQLLSRHWYMLAAALALVTVETLSLQAGPKLTQVGIDDGIVPHHLHTIVLVSALYLAAIVLTGFASMVRVKVTGRLSAWVMNDLRVKVFSHLQRLSLDYFTGEKAGVVMTRMTSDIENLQQLVQDGLAQFAIQGFTMIVVTAVLFTYNVRLALLTVAIVVPSLTVLSIWFRSGSERGYNIVRDRIANVLSDLSENLHGVRVVTAHNRQRFNVIQHRNVVGSYRDANVYTGHINAIYGPGTVLVGWGTQAVLLLVGGHMVLRHQLSIGDLVAFNLYLSSFFGPIQQLVQLYNLFQQGQSSITKLKALLSTPPSVEESATASELPPISGDIVFDHVNFGYDPSIPVLEDASLHIHTGETVAFVGPTGAGKSTMAKLVTRFYDPTSGAVLIDGHDIREVSITSLRRQVGVVPQEPFLFTGTIGENVAFARPDALDSEIWAAVRAVGLAEVIDRLPDKLDTIVHERGQSLSSGERQLIALARAFLAQPRVVVLDEATSNLDLLSESKIESALDLLLEGRTAILIAHRLTTAMKADRIVVVDHGRIVEVGSHAELVASGGQYATMYLMWSSHGRGGFSIDDLQTTNT